MKYYKLVNKIPVPVDSIEEANSSFKENHIIKQDVIEGILVSTIFLFMDHPFNYDSAPILFETMIFGGKHDQYQERYKTYEEAETGHVNAVNLVMSDL